MVANPRRCGFVFGFGLVFRLGLGGFSFLAPALVANEASAALVTYQVDGFVTSVDSPIVSVTPGDLYRVTFTVDDAAADTDSDPTIGVYPGAVTCYTVALGGYFVQGDGRVVVSNLPGQDDVFVEDTFPIGPQLDGLSPDLLTLALLSDATAIALASDAIPVLTQVPPLSPVQFELSFQGSLVTGTATWIQEVPGPCPPAGAPACPAALPGSAEYQVEGIVSSVDLFPYAFALPGEPFTSTFIVDHSVADTDAARTIGVYPGAVTCYTFEIGGYLVHGDGNVAVRDLPGQDDVFVGDTAPSAPLGGLIPFQFTLTRLDDFTATALSNDAIPALTGLSPVSTQQFVLGFAHPISFFAFVVGDITSIQVDHAVTLRKQALTGTIPPGGTIAYTLTVKNVGSFDATNLVISDLVPTNTTYVAGSASDGGSEGGGVISWPAITLAPAQTAVRTVSVRVDPALIVPIPAFSDDMEAGTSNWNTSHQAGSKNWQWVGTNPNSGASSWFGEDVDSVSDQLLTVSTPFVVPAGNSQLEFSHDYSLEPGFDGGVVEISTDGLLWTDLGPHAIENAYDGTLDTCCLNPIGGEPAYTGSSGGYVRSSFDLSGFAGSQAQIRFRLATDDEVAGTGWWVDDVVVRVPITIVNDALATPADGPAGAASIEVEVVPEPSQWMLLLAGLLGLTALSRGRYRR